MKFNARLLQRIKDNDKSLTSVDLRDNEIDDEGAQALAEALKQNKHLTSLNLLSNEIDAAGAQALAEALKQNKHLIWVDLEINQIGAAGAQALAEAFKQNENLTSVYLENNGIGDAGAQALAEAFKQNKHLTSVELGFNGIGAAGAKALAEALKHNKHLTSVDLRGNQIGAAGAKALAEALKQNKTMTSVNLESNQIGAAGAKALAEVFKQNESLTSVELGFNEIGDAGAKALAEALKQNEHLTSIDLRDNEIGTAGAKALAEALKQNKHLTSLNLRHNEIGAAGAKALAEALKQNKHLTSVNLEYNEIGTAGAKALAEALKRNRSNAQALLDAAKTGNLEQVKQLLAAGVSLNYQNNQGNTALHLAAAGGHQAIVDLLYSQPHQVILANEKGECPKDIQPATTAQSTAASSSDNNDIAREQRNTANTASLPQVNDEIREYYQALINNQKQQYAELAATRPELNESPKESASTPDFMRQLQEISAPEAAQSAAEDLPSDAAAKKIKDLVLGADIRQCEQDQADTHLPSPSAEDMLPDVPAPIIAPPVVDDSDAKRYLTNVAQAIDDFLQTPSLPTKPLPHQIRCLQSVAAQLKAGLHHGYINMATGTGKSFIATLLMRILADYYQKNQRSFKALVVAPKLNLAKQLAETFTSMGQFKQQEIQEISSATGANSISAKALICLTIYNSLLNKQKLFLKQPYAMVIFDEAHWLNGEQTRKLLPVLHDTLIQRSPCPLVFSLTATPLNEQPALSGQEIFTYPARQAIKEKMLVPLTWVTFSPVLAKVPPAKADKLVHLSSMMADILLNYRDPNGHAFWHRKTLIFVKGRKNAQRISEQLNQWLSQFNQNKAVANYVISADDGSNGQTKHNKRVIEDFQANKFFILVNVGICTEGFDDKAVQIVIDLTPNKNEKMAIQKAGRALRTGDGKNYAVYLQLILGELPYDYESQQLDEGHNYQWLQPSVGLTRRNDSRPIAEVDDSYYKLNCRSLDNYRKTLPRPLPTEQLLAPVVAATPAILPASTLSFFPPQAATEIAAQKRSREQDEVSTVSKKPRVEAPSTEFSTYKSKLEAHDLYAEAKTTLQFGQDNREEKRQAYRFFEQAKQRYKEVKSMLTGDDLQQIEKRLAKIKAKQALCLK